MHLFLTLKIIYKTLFGLFIYIKTFFENFCIYSNKCVPHMQQLYSGPYSEPISYWLTGMPPPPQKKRLEKTKSQMNEINLFVSEREV